MRIQDLIDQLTVMVEEEGLDPSTEVRLMNQPDYPFEYKIVGVVTKHQIAREDDEDSEMPKPGDKDVVYLLEGTQIGYGTKTAWDCAE